MTTTMPAATVVPDCAAILAAFPSLADSKITASNCCVPQDPGNVSQRILCNGLNRITHIDLAANGLTGPIPNFSSLSALSELFLFTNDLTGTLPEWIGNSFPNMTNMGIYNTLLNGPIPTSFAQLTALTTLDLSNSFLSGDIPTGLANIKNLTYLTLSGNCLNKPAPGLFANIPTFFGAARPTGCPSISSPLTASTTANQATSVSTVSTAPFTTPSKAPVDASATSTGPVNVAAIAGGVAGGVVLLLLIAVGIFCSKRRAQKPETPESTMELASSRSYFSAPDGSARAPSTTHIAPPHSKKKDLFSGMQDAMIAAPVEKQSQLFPATVFNQAFIPTDTKASMSADGAQTPAGDPYNWTVRDVSAWLASNGYHVLIPKFEAKGVDGRILLGLAPEELKMDFGIDDLRMRADVKDSIQVLKQMNSGEASIGVEPPSYTHF
ncbi:hypothetical protein BC830DRAFT_1088102 [Chytriomyces sp. MP71]|nr:hypothetical protein BC830DRAFT_1088102 [Chytriomyces sp. MP71]